MPEHDAKRVQPPTPPETPLPVPGGSAPMTRAPKDPNRPCEVEGCSGFNGPGCYAMPQGNPDQYYKCRVNRVYLAATWKRMTAIYPEPHPKREG